MPKMDGLTACHMIKNDPGNQINSCYHGHRSIGFDSILNSVNRWGATVYYQTFSSEELLDKIAQVLAAGVI